MALILNQDNFQKEIIEFKGIALVDFWATWCGPCRIQGPIIDSLSVKFAQDEQVKVGKIDVDENNELQGTYRIMSIPTIIIFKNGQPVETLIGLRSEQDLENLINKYKAE